MVPLPPPPEEKAQRAGAGRRRGGPRHPRGGERRPKREWSFGARVWPPLPISREEEAEVAGSEIAPGVSGQPGYGIGIDGLEDGRFIREIEEANKRVYGPGASHETVVVKLSPSLDSKLQTVIAGDLAQRVASLDGRLREDSRCSFCSWGSESDALTRRRQRHPFDLDARDAEVSAACIVDLIV